MIRTDLPPEHVPPGTVIRFQYADCQGTTFWIVGVVLLHRDLRDHELEAQTIAERGGDVDRCPEVVYLFDLAEQERRAFYAHRMKMVTTTNVKAEIRAARSTIKRLSPDRIEDPE